METGGKGAREGADLDSLRANKSIVVRSRFSHLFGRDFSVAWNWTFMSSEWGRNVAL